MGQKVHPFGFRLGRTQKHLSNWYALRKNYSKYLFEDRMLRQELYEYYGQVALSTIEIHRKIENHFEITLYVSTERMWSFVGSKVQQHQLKRKVLQIIQEYRKSLFFQTYFANPTPPSSKILLALTVKPCSTVSAHFIAVFLVQWIQARKSFREAKRLLYQLRPKIQHLKGLKIKISGRLNGAEIARSECFRQARLPLHTLKADIDYSFFEAYTIYGVLGVKIWVLN